MKNPYYVVSDEKRVETNLSIQNLEVAVLVCLFYEEQVEDYQQYLKDIPGFIDIYIISSRESILKQFESERFFIIKKENRGRDISALLVAAKPLIFRYKYICFIHDKKEKSPEGKSYTDFWKKNLWDNMLGSNIYIFNLLELFESQENFGMLAPLPPHKEDNGIWLHGAWGNDFDNTRKLAEELELEVPILREDPPYAFSTVFWARTIALKKLFEKSWTYSDFPDEPIKNDGEINHAIERVIQYVVEDSGYEVKIVVSSSFASIFFQQMHDELQFIWKNLDQSFRIRTYRSLENYRNRLERIVRFQKKYNKIYLYGAGMKGMDCLEICRILDIELEGILVTRVQDNPKNVERLPVISIDHFMPDKSAGVIITVGETYQPEIVQELENRGFLNYMIF